MYTSFPWFSIQTPIYVCRIVTGRDGSNDCKNNRHLYRDTSFRKGRSIAILGCKRLQLCILQVPSGAIHILIAFRKNAVNPGKLVEVVGWNCRGGTMPMIAIFDCIVPD
uniref:AlNc14C892G12607 protein n=1 Tax=Albugo laibachii Nc14 TaxID=890382 RepID=F0X284_9STRA|nr:AlNc14C892G12607 [Albugo laibachii Nc14]|eukprot:CCA27962.1 AlNc14C892G12607 [Albugo laibachii Nc14]